MSGSRVADSIVGNFGKNLPKFPIDHATTDERCDEPSSALASRRRTGGVRGRPLVEPVYAFGSSHGPTPGDFPTRRIDNPLSPAYTPLPHEGRPISRGIRGESERAGRETTVFRWAPLCAGCGKQPAIPSGRQHLADRGLLGRPRQWALHRWSHDREPKHPLRFPGEHRRSHEDASALPAAAASSRHAGFRSLGWGESRGAPQGAPRLVFFSWSELSSLLSSLFPASRGPSGRHQSMPPASWEARSTKTRAGPPP